MNEQQKQLTIIAVNSMCSLWSHPVKGNMHAQRMKEKDKNSIFYYNSCHTDGNFSHQYDNCQFLSWVIHP